jgi:hypothetical protein
MSYASGVAAQLESQAIVAADEASRTACHHEALTTKLGKNRLRYRQISHSFTSLSNIVPPYVAQSAARVQNLT